MFTTTRRRSGWLIAAAVAFLAPLASAQPDGRTVLEKARDAFSRITSLRLTIEATGEGSFGKNIMPVGDSRVEMVRLDQPAGDRAFAVLLAGKGTDAPQNGEPEPLGLLLGANDGSDAWLNTSKKQYFRGIAKTTALPHASVTSLLWPGDIAATEPFDRELNDAESIDVTGEETIDGVPCHVVSVKYKPVEPGAAAGRTVGKPPAEIATSARFYIATTDSLPRRIVRISNTGNIVNLEFYQEFKNYELNPEGLALDKLTLAMPEGFTEIDAARPPTLRTITDEAADPGKREAFEQRVRDNAPAVAPTPAPTPEPEPAPAPATPAERPAAPDFELVTTAGEAVTKSSVAGKVTVLYFWGTWCIPCRTVSPLISALVDTFADQPVLVYGVAVRENNAEKPAQYMAEKGYKHTLLLHKEKPGEMRVAREFGVKLYPTVVIVDAEGRVAAMERVESPETPEAFAARVEQLIREELE